MSTDSEWEYCSIFRKVLQSGLSYEEKRHLIALARCIDGSLKNREIMANEHRVQDTVLDILKAHPYSIPLRVTNITGVSDVIACVGGAFVSIEVKDDKEGSYGITKGQRIRLRKVHKCGGVACIVDKNNVDGFADFIESVANAESAAGMTYGLAGEGVI